MRREHIAQLAEAVRSFYSELPVPPPPKPELVGSAAQALPWLIKMGPQVPTLVAMADLFDALLVDEPDARGMCFNLCSANSNPWVIRWSKLTEEERQAAIKDDPELIVEEAQEEYERPYNFDRDVGLKRIYGDEPCEVVDSKEPCVPPPGSRLV